MKKYTNSILASLSLLSASLVAAEPKPAQHLLPPISLGGEVGAAADANWARFRSVPYDSLAWLRADVTGEKASEFDGKNEDIRFRPFKNYSGDISGRFIEIMAMNAHGSRDVHPAFRELLAEIPKAQRPGGYFCATGEIDWQQPIDRTSKGNSPKMMPALWGNSRMLCGLVEACRAFPDDHVLLATTKKLGDFYISIVPRFTDPARMAEYTGGTSYASGYITCWFPAMEGLVKLSGLSGEKRYLAAAITIAAFYKAVDIIPIDHAHGMLCNQVSLLLLFEATKDASYLERVEKRWDELVQGGYINPAGGILEKCKIEDNRDEGCSLTDWLRLNLELGRVTGKTRYWAMAERVLHNHFLQNQTPNGGFGHRSIGSDPAGVHGFGANAREAVWCCSFHGQIGFLNLRSHLLQLKADALTCNFALDFAATGLKSTLSPGASSGEVMRQRILREELPAMVMRVRQPDWADAVTAVAADGTAVPLVSKDGYWATIKPLADVEFIYAGGVYAEDRHFQRLPNGPVAGQPFVLGYGPNLFGAGDESSFTPVWPTSINALKTEGLEHFPAMRNKNCSFVFNRVTPTKTDGPKPFSELSEEEKLSRIPLTRPEADSAGRPDNLALASTGATASASSEHANEAPCAAKVIDGITATKDGVRNRWHSATNKRHPHWIEVKLSKPSLLGSIVIRFADPAGHPTSFQGLVRSADGKEWIEVFDQAGYTDPQVCAVSFIQPMTTDTFRLVIRESANAKYPNAAQVSEIELYPPKK